MANYNTGADLAADVLFRAGEPTDGSSDFNAAAIQYINRAYQIIWRGGAEIDPSIQEDWLWLRSQRPKVMIMQPYITAGTVAVTQGSSGVVFSTPPTPAIDTTCASGWFLQTHDNGDVFRILSHAVGSPNAKLDSVYTGPTNGANSYFLFKLEYPTTSDLLKIVQPMRVYHDNFTEIQGGDLMSLERDYPLTNIQNGVPEYFAPVYQKACGGMTIRFSHYGGTTTGEWFRIEYDYLKRPADLTATGSSVPVMPQQYRRVLSDAATYFLFMDKNDNRADAAGLLAKAGLKAMARENRNLMAQFSREHGQIKARPALLPRAMTPLRTQSGYIIG